MEEQTTTVGVSRATATDGSRANQEGHHKTTRAARGGRRAGLERGQATEGLQQKVVWHTSGRPVVGAGGDDALVNPSSTSPRLLSHNPPVQTPSGFASQRRAASMAVSVASEGAHRQRNRREAAEARKFRWDLWCTAMGALCDWRGPISDPLPFRARRAIGLRSPTAVNRHSRLDRGIGGEGYAKRRRWWRQGTHLWVASVFLFWCWSSAVGCVPQCSALQSLMQLGRTCAGPFCPCSPCSSSHASCSRQSQGST